jgi:hypothetical protein
MYCIAFPALRSTRSSPVVFSAEMSGFHCRSLTSQVQSWASMVISAVALFLRTRKRTLGQGDFYLPSLTHPCRLCFCPGPGYTADILQGGVIGVRWYTRPSFFANGDRACTHGSSIVVSLDDHQLSLTQLTHMYYFLYHEVSLCWLTCHMT